MKVIAGSNVERWRERERKREREKEEEKEGVWLWQSADYIHFARWPPASVFLPLPHTHTLSLSGSALARGVA